MPDAKIDMIQNGKGEGDVAKQILASSHGTGGFSVNQYRPWVGDDGKSYINVNGQAQQITTNAVLRRDEYKHLDMAVMKIARNRLGGIQDLISRGLTYNLTNPMGRTVFEYHDMDDPGEASVSMDGVTRGKNFQPDYTTNYIPLPIVHADFTINNRTLENSRNMGDALDTTLVEAATRRILEQLEDMLFTNYTYTYGGGSITSYISNSDKNSVTLSLNWDNASKTGAQIIADVTAMKQALINAKHYGPYMLYIPTAYETQLDEDYVSGYPKTIRQRILEISGIVGIKVVDRLTANKVLMINMDTDTVRLINGFGPRVIYWDSQGGMLHNFKVMAIQVPQVRADQDGNSGIAYLSNSMGYD